MQKTACKFINHISFGGVMSGTKWGKKEKRARSKAAMNSWTLCIRALFQWLAGCEGNHLRDTPDCPGFAY